MWWKRYNEEAHASTQENVFVNIYHILNWNSQLKVLKWNKWFREKLNIDLFEQDTMKANKSSGYFPLRAILNWNKNMPFGTDCTFRHELVTFQYFSSKQRECFYCEENINCFSVDLYVTNPFVWKKVPDSQLIRHKGDQLFCRGSTDSSD